MKMCKYPLSTRKRIKQLFDQGYKQIDIAKMVGCSRFTVYYSLKMLQDPLQFSEQFLSKRKPCVPVLHPEKSPPRLNNNSRAMRPSHCGRNGRRQKTDDEYNCKVDYKLWNGHIRIKLGETIYSGPPSKYKEGAYCTSERDCSHNPPGCTHSRQPAKDIDGASAADCNGSTSRTNGDLKSSDFDSRENLNDHLVDSLLLKQLVGSKRQLKNLGGHYDSGRDSPKSDAPALSEGSETERLVLEGDSRGSSSNVVNHCQQCCDTRKTIKDINSKPNNHQSRRLPTRVESVVDSISGDTPADMVRLIQETTTKCDSHNTRKHVRAPKRYCSVDDLEADGSHKRPCFNNRSIKTGRFRRLSCRSELTDSEDHSDVEKSFSKVASDSNECLGLLNGDDCHPPNGLEKLPKVRKPTKLAGPDEPLEAAPSTKFNGIDSDFDKVDINLLLEISATDRMKFENKKAKIRRKTADWTLISETERYYNEREEILRNKSKGECNSESDNKSKDEFNSESDNDDCSRTVKSLRLYQQNKSAETAVLREKKPPLPPDKRGRKANKTKSKVPSSRLPDGPSTKELRNRSMGARGTKPIYDLSVLEDDLSDLFETETSFRRGTPAARKKADAVVSKAAPQRHRMTNTERFLKDNKEYYQFPETRDRLRRSLQSPDRFSDVTDPEKPTSPKEIRRQPSVRDSTRRISSDSAKGAESLGNGNTSRRTSVDDEMDNIYFSFEGEPRSESWYQTYQRLIDGMLDNEYKYEEPPFRFLLPYEMPKEYIKDLYSRKFLLRRRNDLSDFVRKSPRCHASTLAFISDLFPTKRKKGTKPPAGSVPVPKKVEEVSSDGASTPSRSSSRPAKDSKGPADNVLAISLYINQVINSSSPPSPVVRKESVASKRLSAPSKKLRTKNRKGSVGCSKDSQSSNLPSEQFNNKLTSEVDDRFLSELSEYMNEEDLYPEDILRKDPCVALMDSYVCECTDDQPSDGASLYDITDASSECVSLCSTDTLEQPGYANKSLRNQLLLKATYKKRRKNMTGWPKQRKRRPPPAAVPQSDDNDSVVSASAVRTSPKAVLWRKKARSRMEARLHTEGSLFGLSNKRSHPRRKASVFYNDAWPVRHRSRK